ncbi:MAG: CDP-alcohol phosphatidyltransferase family protein [Nitriliruptorales bacterium]|nr:CDP-alcohol phosphatidyltransferase family protein [Nitriliruptorales bacterium]
MALKSNFSHLFDVVVEPIGRVLAKTGLTPNALTTLGLVLTGAAAGLVVTGNFVLGGWVLVAGGLMDTFDGAVARAKGDSTPFGGFYDSISDRISDGVILSAIAWALRDDPRLFALAAVALVAAQVTSYVRARAEAIDLSCEIGLMERAERAILLMASLVFHRWLLEPVLWVLAIGSTVTVIQRVHHVWCQIDRDIPEELLALTRGGRAWNRAFTAAARRFYGQNFPDEDADQDPEPAGTVAP